MQVIAQRNIKKGELITFHLSNLGLQCVMTGYSPFSNKVYSARVSSSYDDTSSSSDCDNKKVVRQGEGEEDYIGVQDEVVNVKQLLEDVIDEDGNLPDEEVKRNVEDEHDQRKREEEREMDEQRNRKEDEHDQR